MGTNVSDEIYISLQIAGAMKEARNEVDEPFRDNGTGTGCQGRKVRET